MEVIDHKNTLIVLGNSVGEDFRITARNIVLAAGINTAKISIDACLPTPPSYWLKGNYFSLSVKAPFSRLV